MQQIINFVIRNKTFLLFLFLFGLALALTIQSHSYHRSQFINSANSITGGVYSFSNSIDDYFSLKKENERLSEENKLLREALFNLEPSANEAVIDTSHFQKTYRVTTAQVYKNSYASPNNYLTINKGINDSVQQDFGVITSKGIVGIVDNVSGNYATVLSILNKKSRINAKLKSTNHKGSLSWDGIAPNITQLEDISTFAPVKVGDTIETGGESAIFPKGIGIGTITEINTDVSGDTYKLQVQLFNDMTNLGTIYIIENLDRLEINDLENNSNE